MNCIATHNTSNSEDPEALRAERHSHALNSGALEELKNEVNWLIDH